MDLVHHELHSNSLHHVAKEYLGVISTKERLVEGSIGINLGKY